MHSDRPRQMFQGNWTCGNCGKEINELPFEPSPDRLSSLKCRECHSQSKDQIGGNRSFVNRNSGPKQMFQGNWSCGNCGKEIKELPFQPDPSRVSSLKCRDCFKNN